MVYMYHSFLIHSSADGHLGCFHVLAMINGAAMNIGVHVSLSDLVSWCVCNFCFIDYAKAFYCVDHNKIWKIPKEMGIPDHLICLLRNLYAGQEAIVRTGHGTTNRTRSTSRLCIVSFPSALQ